MGDLRSGFKASRSFDAVEAVRRLMQKINHGQRVVDAQVSRRVYDDLINRSTAEPVNDATLWEETSQSKQSTTIQPIIQPADPFGQT